MALVTLLVVLSAPLQADAARTSRTLPGPAQEHADFTRAEAQDVLDQAKSQLSDDTGRVRAGKPVGEAIDTDITMTLRDLYLARSALSGQDRRDATEVLSRARVYADGETDVVTVTTPSVKCSTNFCVHYRPASMTQSSTVTQVNLTLDTLEHVRTFETQTLGYRTPVDDTPAAPSTDNPDGRFDVFLGDLSDQGLYGYCAPDGTQSATARAQVTSFCVLDNDYARAEYGAAPADSLRVTAAHEYFHAIQFAYDVDEDVWLMEGSATWVEDEVYDSINDNWQFLADSPLRYPRTPLDYSPGYHRYGAWLFFRFASERLGRQVVRQIWEDADAPRDKYSLQAVQSVVQARTSWPSFIALFGAWNTLPANSYSERSGYPPPVWNLQKTLSSSSTSTGWRKVNLPHLSSTAVRVVPHSRLSTKKRLQITVDATYSSKGSTALLQRRMRDGRVYNSLIKLDRYGNGKVVTSFNRTTVSSVVVVLSNTSAAMQSCGLVGNSEGPIYSCAGRGVYDSNQPYRVLARLL